MGVFVQKCVSKYIQESWEITARGVFDQSCVKLLVEGSSIVNGL